MRVPAFCWRPKLILLFVFGLGRESDSKSKQHTRQNNNKNLCQQCQKRRTNEDDKKGGK